MTKRSLLFVPLCFCALAFGQEAQSPVAAGALPKSWQTGGLDCTNLPKWQVQEYNPDFFILRESGCTHYEKPFLYLIFGSDRALLEDTVPGKSIRQAP